jgi:hypothetical protein
MVVFEKGSSISGVRGVGSGLNSIRLGYVNIVIVSRVPYRQETCCLPQ